MGIAETYEIIGKSYTAHSRRRRRRRRRRSLVSPLLEGPAPPEFLSLSLSEGRGEGAKSPSPL